MKTALLALTILSSPALAGECISFDKAAELMAADPVDKAPAPVLIDGKVGYHFRLFLLAAYGSDLTDEAATSDAFQIYSGDVGIHGKAVHLIGFKAGCAMFEGDIAAPLVVRFFVLDGAGKFDKGDV